MARAAVTLFNGWGTVASTRSSPRVMKYWKRYLLFDGGDISGRLPIILIMPFGGLPWEGWSLRALPRCLGATPDRHGMVTTVTAYFAAFTER